LDIDTAKYQLITGMKQEQERIVRDYITAYNNFDVGGMTKDLDENIVFENISNGRVDLRTVGLEAFINQAEAATGYFKTREQTVTSWVFAADKVTVDIDYRAVLQVDIPNGPQAGDTLNLIGQSEFEFLNGRIIRLKDIS